MRNASKNTIKRVMNQAIELQNEGRSRPLRLDYDKSHLFWIIGLSILVMTKGKINNRKITGAKEWE